MGKIRYEIENLPKSALSGNRRKKMDNRAPLLTSGKIERLIFKIRRQNVTLSTHLAELYEVEPRTLVQAVKRNIARFPEDFMFQLTDKEFEGLKSQIVISSWGPVHNVT